MNEVEKFILETQEQRIKQLERELEYVTNQLNSALEQLEGI